MLNKYLKPREIPRSCFEYFLEGDNELFPGMKWGKQSDYYPNFKEPYFSSVVPTNYYIYHLLKDTEKCHFGLKGSLDIVDFLRKSRTCIEVRKPPMDFVSKLVGTLFGNDNLPVSYINNWTEPMSENFDKKNIWLDMAVIFKQIIKQSAYGSYTRINRSFEGNRFKCLDGKEHIITEYTKPGLIPVNYLKVDRFFEKGDAPFKIVAYDKLFFFFTKPKEVYIFTRTDISRIVNYCEAVAGMTFYALFRITQFKDYEYSNRLQEFIDFYHKTSGDHVNKFCESWISGARALKCQLAGPLSFEGYQELLRDREIDGHSTIVPLDSIRNIFLLQKPSDFVDALAMSRICMPPDFDVCKGFSDEKKLHTSKNPVGSDIDEDSEIVYQGFLKYQRIFFITQYFKHFKKLPGVMSEDIGDPDLIRKYNEKKHSWPGLTEEDAAYVDLTGCLKYKSRANDIEHYMKDAAMIPEDPARSIVREKVDRSETNMIVHLLTANKRLDLDAYREVFDKKDHAIRASFKVESGKEAGRLFFIYDLEDKMLMAELEENISDFLIHVSGNAVGLSNIKIRENMQRLNQLEEYTDLDMKPLFMSDDISKWSPKMPVRVQEDSARFWAEIFDQPWIGRISEIDKRDEILINIMNYRSSYKSYGANKEGTSGKRFTFTMIAMKAYCVNILRGKKNGPKLIEGTAKLLTFLDDGLTVVDISAVDYYKHAKIVIESISYIQAAIGYILKIAKCYPSDKYMVFLNYEYFAGKRLYDDGKSFVKLFPRKTNDLMSFTERLREVSTWAIGAIDSSANPLDCYYAYLYRCVYEEITWYNKANYTAPAKILQWISPVAMGGYGALPIHSLAAGVSRSSLAENLKTVQILAKRNPHFRSAFKALLKTPAEVKTPLQILRSPDTPVYAVPHLTEHRVIHAIEDHLLKGCTSVYLKDALSVLAGGSLHSFAQSIASSFVGCNTMVVEAVYTASPVYAIDKIISKVKKASTLRDLLPADKRDSIIKGQLNEVARVESAFIDKINNYM